MKNDYIAKELESLMEDTKDYNTLAHLYSDDAGIKTLARIRNNIGKVLLFLAMSECKEVAHPTKPFFDKRVVGGNKVGEWVKIRPCGEQYADKTYLGILIGDAALGSSISCKDGKIQLEVGNY